MPTTTCGASRASPWACPMPASRSSRNRPSSSSRIPSPRATSEHGRVVQQPLTPGVRPMSPSEMLNIGLMQGFAGLSLFAVLLLMGLGLALIFGQMGVINMAHGEFMTIGAYTIYLGSHLTSQYAPSLLPY